MMQTILPPQTSHNSRNPVIKAFAARAGFAAIAAAMLMTYPASAQDANAEARLRKVEAEVRALQRSVFPGGDGRYFEPQITPGDTSVPARSNAPSTTAVTDILARLDALELQLQSLTARAEESTNSMAMLDSRIAALEARGGSALGGSALGAAAVNSPAAAADTSVTDSNLAAMSGTSRSTPVTAGQGATAATPSTSTSAAAPTPARLAAVKAIAKPQTDDAGDDEYSYGFRLWDAGFYPESRQQLTSFVESYSGHWRQSYAMNLLGRAYLDDGMTEEAARWFLKNYQSDRTAARAPDSLLYLAQSMIALGDTRRACIALAEFAETYPVVATGRLSDQYKVNRGRVTCEG